MSGLGAFIEGAMQGYAFGEGVKRRKKGDNILDEQLKREAERHDWARDNQALNAEVTRSNLSNAEFNRQQAVKAAEMAAQERARMRSIFDETREGYDTRNAVNPADDPATMQAPEMPAQPEAPAAGGRSILGPQPDAPAAPREAPRPQMPAPDPVMPRTTPPEQPPQVMDGMDTVQGGTGTDTLAQPRTRTLFPQEAPHRDEIREYVSSRPTTGGTIPQGAPTPQELRGFLSERPTTGGTIPQGAPTPQELRGFLSERPTTGQNPAAPQGGRAPAVMPGQETTYGQAGLPEKPPAQTAPAAMAQPKNEPGKPPVSPDDPPSVQAAAASAPANSAKSNGSGKKSVLKFTSAQQERASQTFMDYYAKNAVPKVVEMYLANGDIEKAQAFDQWSKARETQSQLKSWSKAVHAATMGDEDGMLDYLSESYNSFDDGYEVIRADSGFLRDDNGNIAGAKLTFKNTQTGEVFSRTYDDQSDLIEQGIYALAPENVFEMLWEQNQQAQKVLVERSAKQAQVQEKAQSAIIAEAARLRKQYTEQTLYGADGAAMPSDDDIMRQAQANVARAQELAAGRAVTQVQPPAADWTGQ